MNESESASQAPPAAPPVQRVLAALRSRGCRVRKSSRTDWRATCPAHDDPEPSLAIRVKPNATILLHCHGGCATAAVLAALGLGWRDLFLTRPPSQEPHPASGATLWQRSAHAAGTCGGPRAKCPCCLDNLFRDARAPERHP